MQAEDGDGCNADKDASQHKGDEPGSAVCGLGRGLGDAHGVDERVREEEEQLHGYFDDNASKIGAGIAGSKWVSDRVNPANGYRI